VEDLCLSFEANEDVLGKIESHELKFVSYASSINVYHSLMYCMQRGKSTMVVNSNKVEYIYLMADYKLNQRAKEQTKAFIHGFRTVVSESWIKLFSPPELQR
jgi:ubiquitin-protein ligase E3 B